MGGICYDGIASRPITPISLQGVDLNKPSARQVKEFPFYHTRLSQLDYEEIIKNEAPFEDPHFPAERS
jgi:hypothetical protein